MEKAQPTKKSDKTCEEADEKDEEMEEKTFESLGLCPELIKTCEALGYKQPTKIQVESIPHALASKDIIGLAQTGSGKTAAFAFPILQSLLLTTPTPKAPFALVIAPTRELAFQIHEQFEALGSGIAARSVTIAGGVDTMSQSIALAKGPHIIVATPGRLVDHLQHTKGFSIKSVKHLVLDEADRLLNMDFEKELDIILGAMQRDRQTYLFSATMTSKVQKLQRASLENPVKVEVTEKYQTVDTLLQNYLTMPAKMKDVYLVYIIQSFAGNSSIIFVDTKNDAEMVAALLRTLGYAAISLHGGMRQHARIAALSKFKSGAKTTLVATDVAARGLDIPRVDLVINYDIPSNGKDYMHRVGRTARAGRSGRALNLVTQYDLENYLKVENLIGLKFTEYVVDKDAVMSIGERVQDALRIAKREVRDAREKKGRRKRGSDWDTEELGKDGDALLKAHGNSTSRTLNKRRRRR